MFKKVTIPSELVHILTFFIIFLYLENSAVYLKLTKTSIQRQYIIFT